MQVKENMEIKGSESVNFDNPYYNRAETEMENGISMMDNILGTTPNERFFRGLILGAAATYLLTNESAQKAIIKAGIKLYESVVGGIEEVKERIMDAQAEYKAQKSEG